jgi:hypothetical protein
MPKLIVNPDSPEAWEIELQAGVNSLGRGEENDFQIEHPSVGAAHCAVTVQDSGVVITDQGSIQGTFVDGALIEEATLCSGEVIKLGEVTLRFQSDTAQSGATFPPAPAANSACKSHPKAQASYHCPACGAALCGLCVTTRMVAGRPGKFCRTCGSECVSLFEEVSAVAPRFASLVRGAFAYPFKHDGLILLGAGTAFYTFINVVDHFVVLVGTILLILGTGYLINYLQRILAASALGDERMPDWPDYSSVGDIFSPYLQFLGALVVSFLPAILIAFFGDENLPLGEWHYPAAVVLGCVLFPMAFMAVTLFDSLTALNPLLLVVSILKIPGAYLLAVLILLTGFGLSCLGDLFLTKLMPIPILPGIVSQFAGLYLATVEMRVLGLLYWTKQNELGWFGR